VHKYLQGEEEETVCGDTSCTGAEIARWCRTLTQRLLGCRVAFEGAGDEERTRAPLRGGWEQHKASVRAKAGHPFRMIKRQFGYAEMRHRG
jgi:transposase, IS5 family